MSAQPASTDALVLRLTDERAVRDLDQLAQRARRVADTGMRLHVVPRAGRSGTPMLAQWVSVLQPQGLGDGVPVVLGLRTVGLTTAAGVEDLDVVVPLGSITERTARMRAQDPVSLDLALPPTREQAAWTALTPPRAGWTVRAEVSDDELIEVAEKGMEAVRAALPQDAGEAVVRQVRARMWGPTLGGDIAFPAGMAFGAHALGFLRPGGRARLSTAGPWTRLDTPGGFVLGRSAVAL
ncbi:hypothetical protein E4A47_01260 [Micrococcus flavus]|uniref:Uncharacterized protein n=1 Tax=Micrococcus flavus TaxID=384602 RepID=A0A4Y8X490_9MICC|nr:hypothetical protein [Micrococcus flavus]MBB4882872.1 hypothetical protein [Micrococcus flavus]TFI04310.1 hypothetical protein E4A47_01260 [Micrococcus flavus]GGK40686.1 hypothetical protein GCM10007073_04490 [Micrococcus flavus]